MSSVIGGYRVYLYVKADARGPTARIRVPEWQASATKTTFSAFRPASRNHCQEPLVRLRGVVHVVDRHQRLLVPHRRSVVVPRVVGDVAEQGEGGPGPRVRAAPLHPRRVPNRSARRSPRTRGPVPAGRVAMRGSPRPPGVPAPHARAGPTVRARPSPGGCRQDSRTRSALRRSGAARRRGRAPPAPPVAAWGAPGSPHGLPGRVRPPAGRPVPPTPAGGGPGGRTRTPAIVRDRSWPHAPRLFIPGRS